MSKNTIEVKAFHSEAAAYAWVEGVLWPDGPICPHCGGVDRVGKLQGKSTRVGADQSMEDFERAFKKIAPLKFGKVK
jgi:hypothetical protein